MSKSIFDVYDLAGDRHFVGARLADKDSLNDQLEATEGSLVKMTTNENLLDFKMHPGSTTPTTVIIPTATEVLGLDYTKTDFLNPVVILRLCGLHVFGNMSDVW